MRFHSVIATTLMKKMSVIGAMATAVLTLNMYSGVVYANDDADKLWQNCMKTTMPSNTGFSRGPTLGNAAPTNAWLMCLSMFCSHNKQYDGCQWYNDTANFPNYTVTYLRPARMDVKYRADDQFHMWHWDSRWIKDITGPYNHRYRGTKVLWGIPPGSNLYFRTTNQGGSDYWLTAEWYWNNIMFVTSRFTLWPGTIYSDGFGTSGFTSRTERLCRYRSNCDSSGIGSSSMQFRLPDTNNNLDIFYNADNRLRVWKSGRSSIYGENSWRDYRRIIYSNIEPGDTVNFRLYNAGPPTGFIGTMVWRGMKFYTSRGMFGNADTTRAGECGTGSSSACTVQRTYTTSIFPHSKYIRANGPIPRSAWSSTFTWKAPVFDGTYPQSFVQELKNFVALQQLEYTRDYVIQQVMPPPNHSEIQYIAYKMKGLGERLPEQNRQRDWQFLLWDFFNAPHYNDGYHVYEHFKEYCSYLDARFMSKNPLCKTPKYTMPWDILASSLLGSTVIPKKEQEHLYSHDNEMYFVTDSDVATFTQLYPDAEKGPTYRNADRRKAALRYIRNVTNAVPLPSMSDATLFVNKSQFIFNEKDGIRYLKAKYDMEAILSLTRQSFLRMYNNRLADNSIRLPTNLVSKTVYETSILGLIEYESNRRFFGPDWYKDMEKQNYGVLLKEWANLTALETDVNYRMMSHLERIEALLAVTASFNINRTMKASAQGAAQADDSTGR